MNIDGYSGQLVNQGKKISIRNSTLILIGFATAFFPRLFSYLGVPKPVDFIHFAVIPAIFVAILTTTKIKDRRQISISWHLIYATGMMLACTVASALIGEAGIVNTFLQFMLQVEPYLLLIAIIATPLRGIALKRISHWILGFGLFNLVLALVQSVLLPMGIYPHRGGTLADNTAGVFASGGGSAGNYVSSTVSIYLALYFFQQFKRVPLQLRILALLAAIYQTQVSDSKQVFLALMLGVMLIPFTKIKNPERLLIYLIPIVIILVVLVWALFNIEADFLSPYQNWLRPEIYAPDGTATQTKLAAFRIIPSYYETPLNLLFGLGPGHTVTRLGGWMLKRYGPLLQPLGATQHPAVEDVWQVISDGWVAKESTLFFPLFTWAGIWGDLGIVGLGVYLYLGYVVWKRVCVDDYCKFLILSTAAFGFILTQMEEPGHMLTVACLLGLRWHEERERKLTLALKSQEIRLPASRDICQENLKIN